MKNSKGFSTKTIAIASLMTALTTVATILISIPIGSGQGFINVGDSVIFFTSITFGPLCGTIAGGIGSALADIILGYAHWALPTLLIKGCEGLVCGLISHKLFKKLLDLKRKKHLGHNKLDTQSIVLPPEKFLFDEKSHDNYFDDQKEKHFENSNDYDDCPVGELNNKNLENLNFNDACGGENFVKKNGTANGDKNIAFNKKKKNLSPILLQILLVAAATLPASVVMVTGYFFGGWALTGAVYSSWLTVPMNCLQAAISIGICYLLIFVFSLPNKISKVTKG